MGVCGSGRVMLWMLLDTAYIGVIISVVLYPWEMI